MPMRFARPQGSDMRVTIPAGYRAAVHKLMQQLQTDDPALAVNHILGCWFAANGCSGQAIEQPAPIEQLDSDDDFAQITEW